MYVEWLWDRAAMQDKQAALLDNIYRLWRFASMHVSACMSNNLRHANPRLTSTQQPSAPYK